MSNDSRDYPIFHRTPDGAITAEWPDIQHRPRSVPVASELLDTMIVQHNASLMRSWSRLQGWVAGDREARVVEIQVTAEDPEYGEGFDEVVRQDFHWEITATETIAYADPLTGNHEQRGVYPFRTHQHVGTGYSLDEAASEVLRCMETLDDDGVCGP